MTIPSRPGAIFLSHGGGPLPVLGDPAHAEMAQHLESLAAAIERPAAIVVVSAHWEEPVASITADPEPYMIYDYYGFPEESYALEYPAPGAPDLAEAIHAELGRHGIESRLDTERGFDHGLFIPLMLMYPGAEIPCIQLSLLKSLDPAAHVRLGEALAGALGDETLLIGSGFSFHNLKAFFARDAGEPDADNEAFEAWLRETCGDPAFAEPEREARLVDWHTAPGARYCHPREEHLLPLHVCYGLARRPSAHVESLRIMGKQASTVIWP